MAEKVTTNKIQYPKMELVQSNKGRASFTWLVDFVWVYYGKDMPSKIPCLDKLFMKLGRMNIWEMLLLAKELCFIEQVKQHQVQYKGLKNCLFSVT